MKTRKWIGWALAATMVVGFACSPALALKLVIDYTYDTNDFFNPNVNPQGAQARATLERAARNFEMFTDHLPRIEEYGGNTWSAAFYHPGTGEWGSYEPGLIVPADTMIVYAGGRSNLGSATLGQGGSGGFIVGGPGEGYQEWYDLVAYRGQPGASQTPVTDIGPWGGSIAFNTTKKWNFDLDSAPASNDQNDFFSVALHELCHVLGFGSSAAWNVLLSGGLFQGQAAKDAYGGPVPLGGTSHWFSDIEGETGGVAQEAAMTPSILQGTRKRLTDLDVAALDDIGWQMPEAGDVNLDGVVDTSDYLALKRNMGNVASAAWADADFDFDGQVTTRDLRLLEAMFPAEVAGQAPEPGSALLLMLGAGWLLRRRGA